MTESQSKYAVAKPSEARQAPEAPPLHVLLDVLANPRRRETLRCLAEFEEPTTIDELAAAVAAREQESQAVPPEEVERVAISLSHSHVPKLEDADVVEYTRKYDEVVLSVDPAVVESLL